MLLNESNVLKDFIWQGIEFLGCCSSVGRTVLPVCCIANFYQAVYHDFRGEIAEESNSIKLLQKKVALRKTRIEQQDTKIKKLQNLLSSAERTKKALSAQCDAFGAKVSI